uniref:Uncharacterized protein n=1 Tax=Anopheles darlingi TaxID=43151 RepID=A0A2M4CS59_ANODA
MFRMVKELIGQVGGITMVRPQVTRAMEFSSSRITHHRSGKSGDCKQKACQDRAAAEVGTDKSVMVSSPRMWRPCPEPPKPRAFSCNEMSILEMPRRKREPVLRKLSCTSPAPSMEAPECIKIKEDLCMRVQVPGCGKVKIPPKCDAPLPARDCKRQIPPVPAFSEGYKNPFPPLPISECLCYAARSVC